jgi:hypothetical protein
MAIRYYFLLRHEHRYKPPGIQDPSAGALVLGNLFMFMVAHLLIETELYEPILGKMRQKTNGRSRHATSRHALSFLRPLNIYVRTVVYTVGHVSLVRSCEAVCTRHEAFHSKERIADSRPPDIRVSGGWTDFSAVRH